MKTPSIYLVALTVTLASMMELLDATIVNVAMPTLMGGFGAAIEDIAWVSTAYVVANVVVLPISGWLSAFYGRRRYYLTSIAVFAVASLGCAASTTLWQLVGWRLLQGLAGGGLLGTSQAVIYDVFPEHKIGSGLAIYGVGVMMGPTLGPLVGGYLLDHASWHWIFLINLPIGLATIALALLTIRDSPNEMRPASVDYAGFCMLAVGVGALQILLERGEHWGWLDSGVAVVFGLTSASALTVFLWWERRVANPIVNLRLFQSREFLLGSICAFCVGFGLYATLFMVPIFLQNMIDYSAYQAGLIIFPGALASAVSTLVLGKLSQENRIDERLCIVIGIAIYCYAMYLHSRFTLDASNATLFFPLLIRGFGLGMIFVPLTNLAMRHLPKTLISAGSGVLNLMRQLGGSVGIAVAATLFVKYTHVHFAQLAAYVTEQRLDRAGWSLGGDPLVQLRFINVTAEQARVLLPALATQQQAQILAFGMLFVIFGFVMAIGIPIAMFMRRNPS